MCQDMLTEQHRVQITERHKKTSFKKKRNVYRAQTSAFDIGWGE